MATYYVRKTGNDGNTGLNPTTQAWLTIDNAANNVAAGDTVYIGSGVYRELVTMDTSGTSGNQISFIGDIDGVQTGDGGPVIITAHDAEYSAPVRAYCVYLNDQDFITWQYVIMLGGTTAAIASEEAANWGMEGIELLDCAFHSSKGNLRACRLELHEGLAPATTGLRMQRCVVWGSLILRHENNAAAHLDLDATIENCLFIAQTSQAAIEVYSLTSDTYSITGITIRNNIFLGGQYAVNFYRMRETTITSTVTNNLILQISGGIFGNGCAVGAVVEDYNLAPHSVAVKSGDITSGGNSDITIAPPLLGGIGDLMFYRRFGWSPWKPWEPIGLLDESYLDPCIEFASATYASSEDMYSSPRPMGRTPADDVGVVEARVRPRKETVTVYSGDNALSFSGKGYVEFLIPVDAESTTVEVYARYDSNYTGTLPTIEAFNIIGDSDQSDVMTGSANQWEKLSISFTPTEDGCYCNVRLWSYDTSGSGKAYFDKLRVK